MRKVSESDFPLRLLGFRVKAPLTPRFPRIFFPIHPFIYHHFFSLSPSNEPAFLHSFTPLTAAGMTGGTGTRFYPRQILMHDLMTL